MRIPRISRTTPAGGEQAKPDPGDGEFADFLEEELTAYRTAPSEGLDGVLRQEVETLKAQLAAAQDKIERLERAVDQDPLLPLLNRRGFVRALERVIAYVERYGARAALIYIDLDDFKGINDRFGHAAGDDVLLQVANAINASVRRSDIVGRLGGDEFAILLWNVDALATRAKATQLQRLISAIRFSGQGKNDQALGASSGFTMLNATDTAQGALARADAGMYAHKRQSRASPDSITR